jgi:biotin synthase
MSGRFVPTIRDLMARGAEQKSLHERAAQAARAAFGRRVFVRAVVEVSNFCRENCHYCGLRRDHRALNRYRAHPGELAALLIPCPAESF